MKLNSILLIFVLLVVNQIDAQSKKKWTIIKNTPESILYIDANNIKEIDNQVSIWSLETFKPIKETEEGKKISKVKTQYLINKLTKKFSEIGSIKYDETGRIIQDLLQQTRSSLQSNVSISKSQSVSALFSKANEYLRTGGIRVPTPPSQKKVADKIEVVDSSQIKKDSLLVKEKVDPDLIVIKGTRKPAEVVEVSNNELNFENKEDIRIEPAKPVVTEEIQEKETIVETSLDYDVKKEVAVEGTIFSDGNLFCVQISSWRNEDKAQRQVNKYKNMGYNSFYTEVYIAKKRSTWYRVRVGYYNSISEAREIARKLR